MKTKIKNYIVNIVLYFIALYFLQFDTTEKITLYMSYMMMVIIAAYILLMLFDILILLDVKNIINLKNSLIQKRVNNIKEVLTNIEKDVTEYSYEDGKIFFSCGILLYIFQAIVYKEFFNAAEIITLIIIALSILKMYFIFVYDEIPELLKPFKFIGIIVEKGAKIKPKNIHLMTITKYLICIVIFALSIFEIIN